MRWGGDRVRGGRGEGEMEGQSERVERGTRMVGSRNSFGSRIPTQEATGGTAPEMDNLMLKARIRIHGAVPLS